ncbi:hypothetical protein BT96DRAFT_929466 [Gymnopus androsaceus JB14]|uniref:Uncharacterized protein n=1 Tax=Gymnopus androsaceus JB14 TaxID=1447944 RepID=A0A6A4GES3_9AGAR|nr:hypothetical protein BT96DRAFT_929466 [Gymnopus androsaceus JB14]
MSEREAESSMSLSGSDDDNEEEEANGMFLPASGTEMGTGCTGYTGSLALSPTTPPCSLTSHWHRYC